MTVQEQAVQEKRETLADLEQSLSQVQGSLSDMRQHMSMQERLGEHGKSGVVVVQQQKKRRTRR